MSEHPLNKFWREDSGEVQVVNQVRSQVNEKH